VRRCERNNSADIEVSEEGGGGDTQDVRAESLPLQLVMKTMVEGGCAPAVHGGPQWSRSPPVACGRDPTLEQGDASRKL